MAMMMHAVHNQAATSALIAISDYMQQLSSNVGGYGFRSRVIGGCSQSLVSFLQGLALHLVLLLGLCKYSPQASSLLQRACMHVDFAPMESCTRTHFIRPCQERPWQHLRGTNLIPKLT